MADDAAKPIVRRSRAGCAECRRRRRRCDEKKPACGYCLSTDQECKYVVKLSWGGRPFSRSIFGQCLDVDDGVAKIAAPAPTAARQPFVYGTKAPPKSAGYPHSTEAAALSFSHHGIVVPVKPKLEFHPSDESDESTSSSGTDVTLYGRSSTSRVTIPALYTYDPGHYGWIPPRYRELLGYFTQKMTRSISCHTVVQNDYCMTLLPMATKNQHLLAAVLYLAACHRTSRGLPQSPEETDHLRTNSLRKLRLALASPDADTAAEAAIASTLVLCIADIVSEVATAGSWRIHMKGALTLWTQLMKDPSYQAKSTSETVRFLKRWYTSFECIAFSCGINPVTRYWSHFERREADGEDYIDDITSFCTALLPVYEEINFLKAADTHVEIEPPKTGLKTEESMSSEDFDEPEEEEEEACQRLIRTVKQLLVPETRIYRFRKGVGERIPDEVKREYYSCDEAYHHMALLQIYTVSPTPISASMVRASVVQILNVVQPMIFLDEPCPAVAILPPLFVAGSQAWEKEDQARILAIMKVMENCWSMGNVKTSRDLLAHIWSLQEERLKHEEKGPFRWEFVTQDDILPY